MASFKDHFSRQSQDYAAYRPSYPEDLFVWLAALAPATERVWDCATGNGQAALGLAPFFRHVIASDASAAQIGKRAAHERIDYLVALAEAAPLRNACCDLVTVAQSAHWFDAERFNAEARRVLRPGGVAALWTYEKFQVEPAIDRLVEDFYGRIVGPHWPPERRHVEQGYRSLPFSFAEIAAPPFVLLTHWALDQVMRYFGTWSAVQRYREQRGEDPLPAMRARLETAWGSAERPRDLRWPIHLRVGRV